MLKTVKILISGQVQGVGFRPYVFKLALKLALKGQVSNNQKGVIILLSGLNTNIQKFYNTLIQNPPPVSKINFSTINQIEFQQFSDFKIIPSKKNGKVNLPLTPDFAICDDCKKDIQDKANRRFNYPFTTCINCGPRWAITQSFPFERYHTSIDAFKMCDDCQKEYTSPTDRRCHSQTNTCPTCGISLFLTDNKGEKINIKKHDLFKHLAQLLANNKIIAIKNASGYLLCCNAKNSEAVKKLRTLKNRPNKPFAVLYPSMNFLQNDITLNDKQIESLTSTQRPITIIPLKNYKGKIALKEVAPGLNQLGIMLPYTAILQLLANELNFPIIATSGNIHGSPIISNNHKALEKLKNIADYFLQHNLEITHPQDDSVVKFSTIFNQKIMFRRSRGYAPNYFNTPIKSENKIMAMGAHLKSTIAFYPNDYFYISQYLGNLDSFDVYKRFTKTATDFIHIFEQKPQIILADKHPLYLSTQYGKELAQKVQAQFFTIQHHKAHFAANLGEHNLFDKKVLGVVFDGTGYGDDTHIWGGEFFDYDNNNLKRIAHLTNFDWLLGDKMSKEPRISLLSLSNDNMLDCVSKKFKRNEFKTYQSLKKTNTLKTSSMGRLFDAVASLLDITDYNTYEGEAAILLENSISSYNLSKCKSYLSDFKKDISAKEIIFNIYKDLSDEKSKEEIAANFLYTLATLIIDMAKSNNYVNIALSGGVFQNSILVDMLLALAPSKINLYFHKELSPNDENISFGQMMYYLNINN